MSVYLPNWRGKGSASGIADREPSRSAIRETVRHGARASPPARLPGARRQHATARAANATPSRAVEQTGRRRCANGPCAPALGIALAIGITTASRGASAASFAKGPYLQDLATDGVTVKLELDEPAPASLSIVDGATHAEIKVDATAPAAFHALRATGLAPSTSYAYTQMIGAGDAAKKSEVGHSTTALADARPFKFLVYGDSRSDDASHAAVVRAMNERPADFLVNTGDVVYRGTDPEEWKSFFRVEGATLRDRCVLARPSATTSSLAGATAPPRSCATSRRARRQIRRASTARFVGATRASSCSTRWTISRAVPSARGSSRPSRARRRNRASCIASPSCTTARSRAARTAATSASAPS